MSNIYGKIKLNSRFHIVTNTLVLLAFMLYLFISNSTIVNAASISQELGTDTTFQIQEYYSLEYRNIVVTVLDRETDEPIEQIKVELYYADSEYAITGSNGQYLTDENGQITFQVSVYTVNDTYHIEINAPGYYPYVGEDFILTGNMDIVIYLDPLPEAPEIPEIEDEPEVDEPEVDEPEVEEEVPAPEENQSEIPKTGDDTAVILHIVLTILSFIGIVIIYFRSKKDEDEDSEE